MMKTSSLSLSLSQTWYFSLGSPLLCLWGCEMSLSEEKAPSSLWKPLENLYEYVLKGCFFQGWGLSGWVVEGDLCGMLLFTLDFLVKHTWLDFCASFFRAQFYAFMCPLSCWWCKWSKAPAQMFYFQDLLQKIFFNCWPLQTMEFLLIPCGIYSVLIYFSLVFLLTF